MIRFRTLGRIDLEGVGDEAARSVLRAPKRLGLLSYLALDRPGGFRRRDRLLALFWPEREPGRARHALRNTLYELRGALGSDALPGRGQDEVGVDREEIWCDAVAFRDALEAGEDADALELYAGELLPGLHVGGAGRAFEDWLEGERSRLGREAAEAADRLAAEAADGGRYDEAARWARRASELAPHDEASLRRLMDLLARAGRRGEALRAYRDFAERASAELGLRPGPDTRALAGTIRASAADAAGEGADGGPTGGGAADVGGAGEGAARRAAGHPSEGRDGAAPGPGERDDAAPDAAPSVDAAAPDAAPSVDAAAPDPDGGARDRDQAPAGLGGGEGAADGGGRTMADPRAAERAVAGRGAASTADAGRGLRVRASRLLRRRPAAALATAAALAATAAAALFLVPGEPTAGPSGTAAAERVAVFPFAVRGAGGADPGFLSGGVATLLAADLDGAGGLRAVDLRALRAPSSGGDEVDPAEARRRSRSLEAGSYVLGDVVIATGRLHLSAALYRPEAGAPVARASVEGSRDELFALVDRLAGRLLAGRYPERELPMVRTAARTTRSLEALKSYLEGEERFRAGRFAAAVAAYREAAEADTAFSLALHRLSVTAEWTGDRGLAREAAERAVRHASRLPERERRLLDAHLTSLRGDAAGAEGLYREILAAYPTDLEAWYQLGEILFHYAPAVGRPIHEARAAFEEVRALSPDHVPSLVHLARIAATEGRSHEVGRLADRVLELVPGSAHAWEMKALDAFAGAGDGDRAEDVEAELLAGLRDASDRSVRLATWNVAVFARDLDGAARMAELLTASWRSPGTRGVGREWRAELALARGRWSDARAALAAGPELSTAFHAHRGAVLAALPFVELPDSALAAVRERLAAAGGGPDEADAGRAGAADGADGAGGSPSLEALRPRLRLFARGLLCSRAGDFEEALERAADLTAAAGAPGTVPLARKLGRIVRAHVAWRRGDPARGLEILGEESIETRSSLMYGVDYVQPYERYLRARLLEDAGRAEEALRWLSSFAHQHVHHLVYLGPSHLRRARILEAAGDTAEALRHYRAFLELWDDPDPELRPLREEAARRVQRLASR